MNKLRMIVLYVLLSAVLIPVSGISLWDDYAPPYDTANIKDTSLMTNDAGYTFSPVPWINKNTGDAGWQFNSYITTSPSSASNTVFGQFRQSVNMPYITNFQFHISYQYDIFYRLTSGFGGTHQYDMEIYARVIQTDIYTGTDTNVYNVRIKKISSTGTIPPDYIAITPIDEIKDYEDVTITFAPSIVSSRYKYSLEFYFTQTAKIMTDNENFYGDTYLQSKMTLSFYYFGVSYESQSTPPPPICTGSFCIESIPIN